MSDLLSTSAVERIEKRLAGVEGSLRRWKLGFAALALVAVGVAADGALKDAEFGTVKAKEFVVVDAKGEMLGTFGLNKTGDAAGVAISNSAKTKAVILTPGRQPFVVDN